MKRLMEEKAELSKRLDIVAAGIALLHKISDNGKGEILPPLGAAVDEAASSLKRFTRAELAERIKQLYPELEFNEGSVMKPLKKAVEGGKAKCVQPNQGNKKQAVYEWAT
jgi:hypothetical protein